MAITDDTGRRLYLEVRRWLEQFDHGRLEIVEVQEQPPVVWAIHIKPLDTGQCPASVVWMGDPTQVYIGKHVWMDNLADEPEVILPLLEAAASGRVIEEVWGSEPEPECSLAELSVEGKTLKVSYRGLNPWERGRPSDARYVYEPWPRKRRRVPE